MPSKALLHASEMFEEAAHSFARMGVAVSAPKLDLPSMMNFKRQGIDGNVKGVEFLMKKNKIDVLMGKGKILGAGKVEVTGADGKAQTVETKNIVIATGSDIARLKGIEIDEKRIVSSTGALSLEKVPGKLLIVGAGGNHDVLVLTVCALPSAPVTSTLPAPRIFPLPISTWILFFFIRNSTPLTLRRSPAVEIHHRGEIEFRRGDGNAHPGEGVRRLLEHFGGVQQRLRRHAATLRRVPPSVGFFSTTATFMPSCAARTAQT